MLHGVISIGLGVASTIGWIIVIGLAGKSTWLISKNYLIALQVTNILNACFSALIFGGLIIVIVLIFLVHAGIGYIFYYKYVMRDTIEKLVYPQLLFERCRKESCRCIQAILYIPHAILFGIIILSLVHNV